MPHYVNFDQITRSHFVWISVSTEPERETTHTDTSADAPQDTGVSYKTEITEEASTATTEVGDESISMRQLVPGPEMKSIESEQPQRGMFNKLYPGVFSLYSNSYILCTEPSSVSCFCVQIVQIRWGHSAYWLTKEKL